MALTWFREQSPHWDDHKERIVGGQPTGSVKLDVNKDSLLPGTWWRVDKDGAAIGYGWMDATWGFAPVVVAVDPTQQGQGVGSFVMDQLAIEAKKAGLAYIFNVIPDSHPDHERLTQWLKANGFEGSDLDPGMLRRRV